jgi:soluble lytic murein transglycosylase
MPFRPLRGASGKKTGKTGLWRRWLRLTFRLLFSPLALLGDSFRQRGKLEPAWIFSFLLLFTVLMGLTGIGILIIEEPLLKTLTMMAQLTENRELLAGDFQPMIRAINHYALQNNIDPNLVFAIIKAESGFNQRAVSSSGARGLMQLTPEVWRQLSDSSCSGTHSSREICHPTNCIYSAEGNIRVGTLYLRRLLDRYQNRVDLALEAYNAGLSNVTPGMEPRYDETRNYVGKTIAYWEEMRKNAINQQLQFTLKVRNGLKWLFGLTFLCWLIFFYWFNRRCLPLFS